MVAANNPFYVRPADPAAALMTGVDSYQFARKNRLEDQVVQGRQDAYKMLMSGDYQGAYGHLLANNDPQGASAVATYAHQKKSEDAAARAQTETERANLAREKQAADALAETRRQHNVTGLTPVKIGSDPWSGDIYGIRDPNSPGGYRLVDINALRKPAPAPQPGAPDAAPAAPAAPAPAQPAANLTGEDYLKTLPPDIQAIVKKVANYEMDPRTSSITGGRRERISAAVAQYDPTYDATLYPSKAAAVKAFATGPQGNTIRSFDVAISHIDTVRDLVKELHNTNSQAWNTIANKFKEQFGYAAPTNFNAAKEILGDEIVKAVVGSNTQALGDRQAIKENFSNVKTPEQLAGVLNTYEHLMAGQVHGIKKQYEDTTRLKNFDSRLSDRTRAVLGQYKEKSATDAARAPPAQAEPKQAPDGNWYVPDPARPGKYLRVVR